MLSKSYIFWVFLQDGKDFENCQRISLLAGPLSQPEMVFAHADLAYLPRDKVF